MGRVGEARPGDAGQLPEAGGGGGRVGRGDGVAPGLPERDRLVEVAELLGDPGQHQAEVEVIGVDLPGQREPRVGRPELPGVGERARRGEQGAEQLGDAGPGLLRPGLGGEVERGVLRLGGRDAGPGAQRGGPKLLTRALERVGGPRGHLRGLGLRGRVVLDEEQGQRLQHRGGVLAPVVETGGEAAPLTSARRRSATSPWLAATSAPLRAAESAPARSPSPLRASVRPASATPSDGLAARQAS